MKEEIENLVKYIEGEMIINPKTQKDKSYNEGIATAISMIEDTYAPIPKCEDCGHLLIDSKVGMCDCGKYKW